MPEVSSGFSVNRKNYYILILLIFVAVYYQCTHAQPSGISFRDRARLTVWSDWSHLLQCYLSIYLVISYLLQFMFSPIIPFTHKSVPHILKLVCWAQPEHSNGGIKWL